MRVLIFAVLYLLASGCASNDYSRFYKDYTAGVPLDILQTSIHPYSGESRVFSTSNHAVDAEKLQEKGFILLGTSSFQGASRVTEKQLLQHAKAVGADIVLFGSSYLGSDSRVVPLLKYNPGQSETTTTRGTVRANAYGTGGSASATGTYSETSTKSSQGSFSTEMVPFTYHTYAYSASFWRKGKPRIFGADFGDIPNSLREELQRNTGAYVLLVVTDSPAFWANIMKGDVITRFSDIDIGSPSDIMTAIRKHHGQTVEVKLIRHGQEKIVSVDISSSN